MKPKVVIIPARLASTRFPRKVLQDIHGKPVIQRCYEGCIGAEGIDEIYVATPDDEIADIVYGFNGKVVMTGEHDTVLGRVAEAADKLRAHVTICVQGDEPMVNPHMVEFALGGLTNVGCSTLIKKLEDDEDPADPNMVKVVVDKWGDIMYASRAVIPGYTPEMHDKQKPIYYKQSCIMALMWYQINNFAKWGQGGIESSEGIDIVRFLENGARVRAVESPYNTQALDVPADLERIRKLCASTFLGK